MCVVQQCASVVLLYYSTGAEMLSANPEGYSGGNPLVRIETDTGIYQLSLVSGSFDPQGGAIMLPLVGGAVAPGTT